MRRSPLNVLSLNQESIKRSKRESKEYQEKQRESKEYQEKKKRIKRVPREAKENQESIKRSKRESIVRLGIVDDNSKLIRFYEF